MDGLEFNKIAASVLIAGIVLMVVSNVADILYQPNQSFNRGYQIQVSTDLPIQEKVTEAPIDIAALMATADASKGKNLSKKCTMCHTFTKEGKNKVGPNLWNIFNNPKGQKSDYSYSKAFKDKSGNWNQEDLFHFISTPKKFIPGTKMAFAGYSNHQEVADVIKYIETLK